MSKAIIKVTSLTKAYSKGIPALKNIDLEVNEGDIFGIIGLSGAGKSTLFRCLTLLERPTSGHIFIDEEPFETLYGKDLRRARKKCGMIFQHFNLFDAKTVQENVEFPLEVHGYSKEERKKRSKELLKIVELEHVAHSYPSQLSGGQKQRVAIARALATYPKILFCDEATSALDPKTTRSILELLKRLNQEFGLTIIMITHQMEVIKAICNKVAVLEGGEVVEVGRAVDLFAYPHHSTTKYFLQTMLHDIPQEILPKEEGKNIFRLGFRGDKAKEPIISRLIRTHAVDVNILLGSIDHVQSTTVGNLVVELVGEPSEVLKARQFLADQGVSCEVI